MIRTGGARTSPVRRCARCGLVQPPANFCRNCGYPNPAPLPAGYLPRARTGFLASAFFAGLTLVAAGMLACVLVFIFASTGLNLRAITIAVSAAVLPTGVYGALLLRLDRDEPESREARALAFFWGAVISIFLALLLETVAQSFFYLTGDPDMSGILTAVIAAPLIEESAKGMLLLLALWFFRRHIDGVLDGMLFGALVGLGFAMTENIAYFGLAYADGGAKSVGLLFVVRCVINGFGHSVFTSFTGAAVGWARARHGRGVLRLLVPAIGWGAAVISHGVWNLFASIAITVLSIGLERVFFLPEWQAFLVGGIVGGLPFSVPPLLTALVIALLGREQEQRVVREYLPIEVSLGTITPEEYQDVVTPEARKRSLARARDQGGSLRRNQQRRFNEIVTALAFFHYHAVKGERPYLPEIRRAEQMRWNLSGLRWAMANPERAT